MMWKLYGAERPRTDPYVRACRYESTGHNSKVENAIVERMNKEINRHIRSVTYDNNSLEDCKIAIPFVMRIINSNYSDRLKISSSQLLFGNFINLDRGFTAPPLQIFFFFPQNN